MKNIIKIICCMSFLLLSASPLYSSENLPGKETNATQNPPDDQPQKIEEVSHNPFFSLLCVASSVKNHPLQRDNTSQQEEKYKSPDKGWWSKLGDDPIALFTALLFFATLALFWATYRLVTGSENTAKRQLRAYVFVSLADGEKLFLDGNGCLSAPLIIKNYGQTPAYNLKCNVFIGPCKLPLAEILDPPNFTGGSVGCLPHNQAHRQYPTVLRPLTETEIEGITSGKYGMFVGIWNIKTFSSLFKMSSFAWFPPELISRAESLPTATKETKQHKTKPANNCVNLTAGSSAALRGKFMGAVRLRMAFCP